jgi:hypothetical protein
MTQVTYSLGIKRAIPNTYSNYSPFFSITEDVREGETPEEAYDRLEELVEKRMGLKVDQLDGELGAG